MQTRSPHRWWLAATEIQTERLVLRAICPADAAALGQAIWTNRDHLAPWIDVPEIPLSAREWRRRTRRDAASFVRGARLLYAVRRAGHDRLLGCVALTPMAATCELSYWLASTATSRGYAREAAAALAALAHRHAGTALIRCRAENVRSAAVARALGATLTGLRDGIQEWILPSNQLCTAAQITVRRAGTRTGY